LRIGLVGKQTKPPRSVPFAPVPSQVDLKKGEGAAFGWPPPTAAIRRVGKRGRRLQKGYFMTSFKPAGLP
jgi:hypothetical protein